MKMAWRIICIMVACVASFSDGVKLFPRPSLTENRSARVLKLDCKPPEDTASWQDVYDIRVFVCLPAPHFDTCVNHTVASMTSAMTSEKKQPTRGPVLPSIAKVTFSGGWTPAGSPSLTVETPFSSEYYGVYFCTAEYSSSDGSIQSYTAAIHANVSGQANFWRDHFHIEIMEAHALYVTWQSPIGSAFQEGVVTRMSTDREGTVTAASRSLFMATTKNNFPNDDEGVLLARFEPPNPPEENYTMAVYVDSKMCSPFCQYSCSVPYEACIGPDALFCECNHEENVAPPAVASAGLSKGGIGAICLALLIVVFVVLIIVLVILLRRGKLPRLKALLDAPTATDERNIGTGTQTEHIQQAAYQRVPEDQAKPEEERRVNPPPRKPHGNRSKNRQRYRQRNYRDTGTPSCSSDDAFALHRRAEDSDWSDTRQKNEPPNPPSDDARSSPEETEEQGATGGENTPLVNKESDNTQPGTEKKGALHPSPEQTARICKTMGGGARPKDTHQNPAASLSPQPDMGTCVSNPPSTSKYSDRNPPQAEESTPKQHQPKMEFDHMKGDHSYLVVF